MHRDTPRPRAADAHNALGTTSRRMRLAFAAVLALAMAAAVMIASTAPAPADTSSKYQRLWDDISKKNKRWARRTSECESGGNRKIHSSGGTYHGAFQFSLGTWRNSPKSPGGDPHRYSWKTQAVVAVHLKKRDGARNHWPVCG